MMHNVSPGLRRLLAVSILIAFVSLIWSAAIEPALKSYTENVAQTERMHAAIARSRASANKLEKLRADLERAKESQAGLGGFLDASNESIASAEMQDLIRNAVTEMGGDLRSTQMLNAVEESSFRRITMEAQLAIDIEGFRDLLYELEAATPYLFVDAVIVSSRPPRRRASQADGQLDVTLTVSGYVRPVEQVSG
ncbi:type II secretion system protein GspM [Indioceanicola profundi]|uniref:type II secretion system protein GspM n=1 Tax=Indioceanicola profundi TaxID=2220096 RepID=UPI000E6ADD9E|nr:type II secretion system protein GspM [Indioceanicola profundi]